MDRLTHPESILNLSYWSQVVELLLPEIAQKKRYHARRAAKLRPLEKIGEELPSQEEVREFKLYQYHLQSANLFYAIETTLNYLIEGTTDLSGWYGALQHQQQLADGRTHQMIIDLEYLYKEVEFWKGNFFQESSLHTETTDVSLNLLKQLKSQSHDCKL